VILLDVIELRSDCSMPSENLLARLLGLLDAESRFLNRRTQPEMGQATRVSYRTCTNNRTID